MSRVLSRRAVIRGAAAGAPAFVLAPIGRPVLAADSQFDILNTGEWLAYRLQRAIGGGALAPEFAEADLSPVFRTNGNTLPSSASYQAHAARNFEAWKLVVNGLVDAPRGFSLAQLRALPARTQITLHNCVEGWSAIGKWKGVQLGPPPPACAGGGACHAAARRSKGRPAAVQSAFPPR